MNYLVNRYIEKIGVKLHRVGKTKAFYVSGEGVQEFLINKSLKQPFIRKFIRFFEERGIPDYREQVKQRLVSALERKGGELGGTISGGKAYLTYGRRGVGSREILHHELAHLHPIAGKFETYAHIAGGLRRKKGKLSPLGAVKSYGDLWRGRPARATIEHSILGGGALGVKKLITKKDKTEDLSRKFAV